MSGLIWGTTGISSRPHMNDRLPAIRGSVRRVSILLLAGLCAYPLAQGAQCCESDSAIDAFEARIATHKTIRLKFRRESRSLLFGEREPESGTLWLGPPKRYRVETDAQTVVRGTDTLWTHASETNQVTIRAGKLDSLEFGPAGFFGSLRADFLIVDCEDVDRDGQKTWRIRLAAKTETAAIQRLTLWINAQTHWADKAEYVDYNEETSTLYFSAYETDDQKDSGRFSYSPLKGAEVIVLPSRTASDSSSKDN